MKEALVSSSLGRFCNCFSFVQVLYPILSSFPRSVGLYHSSRALVSVLLVWLLNRQSLHLYVYFHQFYILGTVLSAIYISRPQTLLGSCFVLLINRFSYFYLIQLLPLALDKSNTPFIRFTRISLAYLAKRSIYFRNLLCFLFRYIVESLYKYNS